MIAQPTFSACGLPISGSRALADVAHVVAHLGAVQSQDYPAATWALGLRLLGSTSALSRPPSIKAGSCARTCCDRPGTSSRRRTSAGCWRSAAPRIRASVATYTRSLGLDEPTLEKVQRGHRPGAARRQESDAGRARRDPARRRPRRPPTAPTLGRMLFQAELEGLVCSGPRRGRNHTYALLDERAPMAPTWTGRGRCRADLAVLQQPRSGAGARLRVVVGVWRIGEINRGLEANATRLHSERIDGQTYWFATESLDAPLTASAFLLPNYDEYTVAYRERDLYYDRAANRPATRARTCRSDMCCWWMAR